MSSRSRRWGVLAGVGALAAIALTLATWRAQRGEREPVEHDATSRSRDSASEIETTSRVLDREPIDERVPAAVAAPAEIAEPRPVCDRTDEPQDDDAAIEAAIAVLRPKLDESARAELADLVARRNAEVRSRSMACSDAQAAFLTAKIDAGLADGPTPRPDSIASMSRTSLRFDGGGVSVSASLRRGESEDVDRAMEALDEARSRWRRELRAFLDRHAR